MLTLRSAREAADLRSERENLQNFVSELESLRTELLRIAALPYKPNLNDGVLLCVDRSQKLSHSRGEI